MSTKYSGWLDGTLSEREYGGQSNSRLYDEMDVWENSGGVVDVVVRSDGGHDTTTLDAHNHASATLHSYNAVANGGTGHSYLQYTDDVTIENWGSKTLFA